MATADLSGLGKMALGPSGKPLERMREELQILLGTRGDPLDAALTLRSAIDRGLIDRIGNAIGGATYVNVFPGYTVPDTSGGGGTYEPDLTPPPNVTGLSIVAGFSQVLVQWAAPAYTQGHGHLRTNLYAVKKAGSDATLPTFGDSVRVFSATGPLTIASLPSELNTRWHVWAKYETVDGVESPSPAGGANGVSDTTGQDITQLLTILTGQIREAQLYSSLGARINLIDTPTTGLTDRATALETVTTNVTSGNTALATRASTLEARVNTPSATPGNAAYSPAYAAVVAEASARATLDGAVHALYTVRAEVSSGGRTVTGGFGLAASGTATEGPRIDFGVRADRFFVDAPAGSAVTTAVTPFVVQTTSVTANGVTTPAGVYMDAAYINNLSAMWARFGTLIADSIAVGQISASNLTLGTGAVGGNLRSTSYTAGSGGTPGTGWLIQPNGNAFFNNALFYGTIYAGDGAIGGITIQSNNIRSSNFAANTSGFQIAADGSAEFNDMVVRGSVGFLSNRDGTGTSRTGAGYEQDTNGYRVYDTGGVARVELGYIP